jgi:hypothetical protein
VFINIFLKGLNIGFVNKCSHFTPSEKILIVPVVPRAVQDAMIRNRRPVTLKMHSGLV